MKMSEIFEMPVTNKGRIRVYITAVLDEIDVSDAEKAAAHAINCHDELVEALEELLQLTQIERPDWQHKEQHQAIKLLAKARGE